MSRRIFSLSLLVLSAACAPAATVPPAGAAPAPTPAPAAAAAQPALPHDIHWVRNSAEYRALALQVYRDAGDRLRELSRGMAQGSWGVILDADETVLDNSEYQKRRALAGAGYSDESWNAWVRERAAGAVPGAPEFTRAVRELGGRVVIVTNRDEAVCAETRENLRKLDVAADLVLCRPQGQSDKNPRFQAVGAGTAGLPPLRVLEYVGDNIQDFPGLSQAARPTPAALEPFGRSYFMLPDPMYGSWERNPMR
ncbi:MAG: hypothetical protein JO040_09710 [Gemmatimonadetes bacterium]|nr:hypothetical protein [Gemmatimonadota bacterium]